MAGGDNSSAHTHGAGSYANSPESAHTHGVGSFAVGAHKHIAPVTIESGKLGRTDHYGSVQVSCTYNYVAEDGYTTALMYLAYTSEVAPSFSGTSGAGSSHTHTFSGTSGPASVTENRPAFLSCFWLMKVF
jgi:hypothetical protein